MEVSQLDDAGNEVIQVDQSLPVGKAQGQGTQDLLADGVAYTRANKILNFIFITGPQNQMQRIREDTK